jgi:Ca2+-binding EF-hand superfamily protein
MSDTRLEQLMTEARQQLALDPEFLRELQDDFEFADGDHDGHIDFGEFSGLLDELGAEMSATDLRIGFEEIDTDRNGRIGFYEFVAWWTKG